MFFAFFKFKEMTYTTIHFSPTPMINFFLNTVPSIGKKTEKAAYTRIVYTAFFIIE